jgi:RNA polymerase sigma-70 factor (ECF subfamily)
VNQQDDPNVSPSDGAAPLPADHDHRSTPFSLLDQARAHSPDAWRRLVALYRPLVVFWCSRAGVPVADTEDVAQDIFTGVASHLERFRRDRPGDSFRGWLRGITRNCILLYFRRNRGRPMAEGGPTAAQKLQDVVDPLPGPGEEESAEVGQLYRRALEQVRGQFEERTWQAFWRTAIEGQPPALLTEELGMTANGIRQAKSRVLRRLREEMGDLID